MGLCRKKFREKCEILITLGIGVKGLRVEDTTISE